jgi:hypothetical protein
MSEAGKRAKAGDISRKKARKNKKEIDKLARDTNKAIRDSGGKIVFEKPAKGGRRRFKGIVGY